MKELSIEEKAKAYEEKLDVARHIYADPSVKDEDKYYIEVIFPELTESEDERIRKKIIATIHLYYGEPLEDEAKEMIAWLEKRGEQKPAWNEEEEYRLDIILERIERGLIVDKEHIDWLKSLKDRVQPQHKQEWSMYDETILKALIDHFEYKKEFNEAEDYDIVLWLKSLRPENRWKPTEELLDVFIKNAVDFFESNFNPLTDGGVIGAFDDKKKMIEEFKEYMKEEGFNEEWI